MKKEHSSILMLTIMVFGLLIAVCGCNKDSTTVENPKEDDPEKPQMEESLYDDPEYNEGDSVVLFRLLNVAEAQKILQGKWDVFYTVGGVVGDEWLTGYYREFIGTDTLRLTNPYEVTNRRITKWERTKDGMELSFSDGGEYVTLLQYIKNDTLSYMGISKLDRTHPIVGSLAKRVK